MEEYAERAAQINQCFLTVTDHGMQGAVPRQIRACEVAKIKPVFGCELYLNNKHVPKSEMENLSPEEKAEVGENYHLLAIAYTNEGYSNLVQLTSQAWLQFYKKPRVNYAQIDKHKKGIIFTSSCYIGEIGKAFEKFGSDRAEEVLKRYIDWFSPDFYLELMLLDFKKQKPYDTWLVKMHEKYHIPMIVSGDVHYCRKEDSQQQRYMLMIRGKKTIKDFENIEDGADYFELQDTNLWMKSEEELDEKWFKDYSDVIPEEVYTQAKLNTVAIARKASVVEIDRSLKLPYVPEADERLKEAVLRGYKWRGFGMSAKYINRLKEEFDLICKKGFSSYFLIQQQITNEARRVCPEILGWGNGDEAVGPGRGCLDGDTRIVTPDGCFKKIKDMTTEDSVVTRDGSVKKVEQVLVYDCKENLLNIKVCYGDNAGVTLTKDHKVLAEKAKNKSKKSTRVYEAPKGELDWVPAGELKKGDWLFIPQPEQKSEVDASIDLVSYVSGNFKWDEEYLRQEWADSITGKVSKKKVISRYIPLDEQWFYFLGVFSGEGWLLPNVVGFHCYEPSTAHKIANFCQLQRWDYKISYGARKNYSRLVIKCKALYQYMVKHYDVCKPENRHVPAMIFDMPICYKEAYLFGFMTSGPRNNLFTTSSRLASQIRYLAWQCRIPASFYYYMRTDYRTGKEMPYYKVNIPWKNSLRNCKVLKDGLIVKIRKIVEVEGDGKVYDLTIADNHSYLTTSFLVHNSAVGSLTCYCLGITDVDPLKHDLLFSRFLSESRGGRELKTRFSGIPIPEPI